MATTVDTLLVRIEADLSSLRRDLRRVENTTRQAGQKVNRSLTNMETGFSKVGDAVRKLGPLIAAGFAAATVRSFVRVGSEVENLEVRLRFLFGSVEEGAKAFDIMARFASQVPFSLQEIQNASGSLAAVATEASDLNELLKIIGNVAAVSGLSFQEAAGNLQRAFSAGANSADLFRERGVLALAGFEAGATVSVEQTIQKFQQAFGTGGEFDGATQELSTTFTGTMSMLGDAIFQFQRQVAESGLLDAFKELVDVLRNNASGAQRLATIIGRSLAAAVRGVTAAIEFALNNLEALTLATIAYGSTVVIGRVASAATAFVVLAKAIRESKKASDLLSTAMKRTPWGLLAAGLIFLAAQSGILDDALEEAYAVLEDLFPTMQSGADDTAALSDEIANLSAKASSGSDEVSDFDKAIGSLRDRTIAAKLALQGMNEATIKALQSSGQFANIGPSGAGLALTTQGTPDLRGGTKDAANAGQLTTPEFEALKRAADEATAAEAELSAFNDAMSLFNGLMEDSKTPVEVFKEDVAAIRKLHADGAITKQQEQAALAELVDQYRESNPTIQKAKNIVASLKTEEDLIKESMDAVSFALKHQSISADEAEAAMNNLKEQLRMLDPMFGEIRSAVGSMSTQISSAFADMVMSGKMNLDSLKDIFSNFVRTMIAKAFELMVMNKIMNSVFNLSGNAALPTATLAGGGTINGPTIVGERGPELFVPSSTGSIKNNMDTKNILGGGSPTVVNQTLHIETGVSQTVRAEILNLMPQIRDTTIAAVVDQRKRGGALASAFGA